jgi:NAD(P)-dependent dehydrogenase (short-subunit alcohol dehydrogenase family)
MLAQGSGAVVMLSSAAAWISGPPSTVYASSKFAVDGSSRACAGDARHRGARALDQPRTGRHGLPAAHAGAVTQPGDPDVPLAPGVPASWVADAVLAVAAASHASDPLGAARPGADPARPAPPVGFVVDVVLGRYATSAVAGTRRMVDRRVRALLGR